MFPQPSHDKSTTPLNKAEGRRQEAEGATGVATGVKTWGTRKNYLPMPNAPCPMPHDARCYNGGNRSNALAPPCPKYVLLLSGLVLLLTNIPPAFAHSVKTSADVGATLHVEPNDNPRAGEPSKTWFALTRKGGKAIPLKECNCQLAVYAKPYAQGEPPLLEPALQPITAERYQGIPGTEITFPKPGAYQLQLSGKPKTEGSFQPFKLKFEVIVAAGSGNSTPEAIAQDVQNVKKSTAQSGTNGLGFPVLVLSILTGIGVLYVLLQRGNRS
ncbi:MAG: hypothetical protein ACHBN1_14195 [Heteroscytonema crispum UTEX LB 1556]